MTASNPKPVWFLTGCSTGFGRELARQLLDAAYPVVVTARKPEDLAEFSGRPGALVLRLDVTDPAQVKAAVDAAEAHFGRIDMLVNNAGIGYFGSVEESEEAEVRRMFEINVFALGQMSTAVLPLMRRQRSGVIVNIASLAGIRPSAGLGYYNATKFAVIGLSGALQQEVSPLGIRVIVVEPSGFRTDWAGRSANESPRRFADYQETAWKKCEQLRAWSGHQPGDPARAAQAIIAAATSSEPPHHLPLGVDAFEIGTAQFEKMRLAFLAQESVARHADAP